MFAARGFKKKKAKKVNLAPWLKKTNSSSGFTIPACYEGEAETSPHSERAGSRRGLVGQSRGLLIYTFHKIIHVRGIPLPIWLVRTRVGGVFMEVESGQKPGAADEQWCGLISINANIRSSVNRGIVWWKYAQKRRTDQLSTVSAEASNATGRITFLRSTFQ